jgi:hypothetical protein
MSKHHKSGQKGFHMVQPPKNPQKTPTNSNIVTTTGQDAYTVSKDKLIDTGFSSAGTGEWDYETGTWKKTKGTGKAYKWAPMCYEDHPALPLGEGLVIYGGSCSHPVVKDADVYIGLDSGMVLTKRSWPWEPGQEVFFKISDMQAPPDAHAFVKLIDWTAGEIISGRKVHVGCIGGHGRTGTVFAALAKVMLGEEDAIEYVRKNYCKKAVESDAQINFLHTVFGIKKVAGSKSFYKAAAPLDKGGKPDYEKILFQTKSLVAIRASFCMWGGRALPLTK